MNKERRQALERAKALIEEASEIVSAARDEEQDYFDNMPENLQSGDKGSLAEEACAALENAVSSLEDATSGIEEAIS